jgi:hypothetical protein
MVNFRLSKPDLPHDKKTRIGGDLRTLKIDADGPVETRP